MRIKDFGTFGICMDVFDKDRFEGRLYVPVYPQKRNFKSMHGLIVEMNKALEIAGVPHPFFEYRTFDDEKAGSAAGENSEEIDSPVADRADVNSGKERVYYDHERYSGEKATFLVNVLYRQNATWQGTVSWVEEDKKVSFRSALELFVLMESAMR